MLWFLGAVVIAWVAGSAHAQTASESLTLQSATYSNFRQLLSGAAPDARVAVHALLEFPAAASGCAPAVVLVHTLAGYRDQNEGWQASALREAGFATLTYDSFAARGMGALVTTPMRGLLPTRQRSPMRLRRLRRWRRWCATPASIPSASPFSAFRSAVKWHTRRRSSVFAHP